MSMFGDESILLKDAFAYRFKKKSACLCRTARAVLDHILLLGSLLDCIINH